MDKPTNIEIETPGSGAFSALEVKTCCAAIYQSDWARLLLGDSFHPGGMALTEHLGMLLDLAPGKQVLDVAAGQGTSAIFLAQRFGCQVVGLDYGEEAVRQATQAAEETGIAHLVRFEQGDAECLSAADGAFDAVICECAFCTFPDKRAAADEFARVLRPGGRVGLSDLTRAGAVPSELQGLLAWAACIADAQPLEQYAQYLAGAGLAIDRIEPHDHALNKMVHDIRTKLLAVELLVKFKRMDLDGVDFEQGKKLVSIAGDAMKTGLFGYAIIIASKAG
jgi:arsenite methyltransferase